MEDTRYLRIIRDRLTVMFPSTCLKVLVAPLDLLTTVDYTARPASRRAGGGPRRPRRVGRRGITIMVALGLLFGVGLPVVLTGRGSQPSDLTASSPALGAAPPENTLSWAPPQLTTPVALNVTSANRKLVLDVNRDYRIVLPSTPLTGARGLTISGGHNVVLIGGEIQVPSAEQAPDPKQRRGLYLKGQTGTVHVEGLHIAGADLSEGIDLDQRLGATVQLENIRVERTRGSRKSNHADIVQAWAGPNVLRIDRFTGSTDYQGFFLLPRQHFDGSVGTWDLRRVDLTGAAGSGFMLWKAAADQIVSRDVYVRAEDRTAGKLFRPSKAAWPGVTVGSPPGGEFVPAGAAGIGYVSPGYGDSSQPGTRPS